MNLMTASKAETFYNQHTKHRYNSPGSLILAMQKAQGANGPFAWVDPKIKRAVTNEENVLAFIEWKKNRPPTRHQRKTVTSATVSALHGQPIGKAAKEKPVTPLRIPDGGEIRINSKGVEYIYLPPSIYGEPVRSF